MCIRDRSVGVLYIPSDLYKTTRDISISFNQLCKDSHERIKYKKYCPSWNKEIKSNDDIIKGYEYEMCIRDRTYSALTL